MIWLTAVLSAFGAGLTVWMLMRRHSGTKCPTCQVPYTVVHRAGDGLDTSYDVLACPSCTNTITRVHGQRSPLAYCPACHQRAMTPRLERTPGDGLTVTVHEECVLCAHEATHVLHPPKLATVLPFPGSRSSQDHGPRHGQGTR